MNVSLLKEIKRTVSPLTPALSPLRGEGDRARVYQAVWSVSLLVTILVLGSLLQAAEQYSLPPETAGFKNGPGVELAIAQCLLCHSADYVSTQPRLSRTAWKASVVKMRDKYGAPLPEDKIEAMADYLVKTYGAEAK